MSQQNQTDGISRRGLLASAAAMGAGAAMGRQVVDRPRAAGRTLDDVNVAVIGVGCQGGSLLMNLLKMRGIRIKAVCDIWPYRRKAAERVAKRYKHDVQAFGDYREMLATVKDLDAAVIATPDWMHAEHALACMGARLQVYCERPMSNTLARAAEMVKFSRLSGRLLQIGYQRRSNPRYVTARKYIREKKAVGRLTHVVGQWHSVSPLYSCPDKYRLPKDVLTRFGYASMAELRNWRWYRRFSGGLIADVGAQQVDVFNWFLGARPKAIQASGGSDYHTDREHHDNISVMYEWDCDQQGKKTVVRGFYQVLTTTTHGRVFETLIGDRGSLTMSESCYVGSYIRREHFAPSAKWEAANEILVTTKKQKDPGDEDKPRRFEEMFVCKPSQPPPGRLFPIRVSAELERPPHRWHLENFFAAVRDPEKVKLNCPAEVGFGAAASVLLANAALAKGDRLAVPDDTYKVS